MSNKAKLIEQGQMDFETGCYRLPKKAERNPMVTVSAERPANLIKQSVLYPKWEQWAVKAVARDMSYLGKFGCEVIAPAVVVESDTIPVVGGRFAGSVRKINVIEKVA